MLNGDFIDRAFSRIELYFQILKKRERITSTELKDNHELLLMIAHALQLAVQGLIDVGTHILSEIGSERWEEYADVPRLLTRHKILSENLAETFVEMIKMRNVLAHEYLFLDAEIIAKVLNNNLRDIPSIILGYKAYLEERE